MKIKPIIPNLERRSIPVEIRAKDENEKAPCIRGHAAVFNSPSELLGGCFREIILPGAFAEAIDSFDTRALFNHDSNIVIGRKSAGTLRMKEDESGLAIEIDLPDTSFARDIEVSMRRGDIKEMSYSFVVADGGQRWDRDPDGSGNWTRTISKIERVFDVSPVTYPAYTETDCAMRSLDAVKASEIPPVNDDEIAMRRLRLELEAAY
jgi:HK97 family phage prohead protease